MKVVVVSQRVDVLPERAERRDALDQRLCDWLMAAGYLPVPVPNALVGAERLDGWLAAVAPNGVVLSGGNDMGQCPDRDDTERGLASWAERRKIPVLGICRGMQMLAARVGCGLKPVTGHVRTRHRLSGKISGEANSFHNHALSACPEGFEVLASSEDGEIEAIRHASLPWEGWMWHPERESDFSARDTSRLQGLLGG